MTLEEQIARIIENAERGHELAESTSTIEENAANFVAWCNAQGIESLADDSTRA